jgi:YggT family protein
MGDSYLADAVIYLVDTVAGLYLIAVILRFLLQLLRADFYNPLSQFVVNITNPPLRPLRRFIPGFRGLDIASLTLAFIVATIKLLIISTIAGITLNLASTILLSIADILQTTVYIFIFITIARAVLSWFQQGGQNPIERLLSSLSEPLLKPLRRILPELGGLDFSPFALIILLTLILKLIVKPITDSGYMMLL